MNKKLKLKDFEIFKGVITKAEMEQRKGMYLIHLEIEPLDFKVKGKTGKLHSWYKFDEFDNDNLSVNTWTKFMEGMYENYYNVSHDLTKWDYEKLINMTIYFERKEYAYGVLDKNHNLEYRTQYCYIPVRGE